MKKVMYLCNDRIFETYEDAAIDCAERGIWGSSSKDHIEELPYIGRTYAEGAAEGANNIINFMVTVGAIDERQALITRMKFELCQPQETEGE